MVIKNALTDCKPSFFRASQVKNLLVDPVNSDAKIRISQSAKCDFYNYIDSIIKKASEEIVSSLPRKTKGEEKGNVKRITIQEEDFNPRYSLNRNPEVLLSLPKVNSDYSPQYVKHLVSLKPLFQIDYKYDTGIEKVQIRIAQEAKGLSYHHLDKAVDLGIKDLINKIPRFDHGEKRGQLKRITIHKEDF